MDARGPPTRSPHLIGLGYDLGLTVAKAPPGDSNEKLSLRSTHTSWMPPAPSQFFLLSRAHLVTASPIPSRRVLLCLKPPPQQNGSAGRAVPASSQERCLGCLQSPAPLAHASDFESNSFFSSWLILDGVMENKAQKHTLFLVQLR